ncbi:MAG: Lrp/AsnC family transcriptional regulator [Desulfobulbaceae bacterium]|nr:MAG: Lrp/AsnC family transcriptional regulator [Desulfobulbaceae bacterium]
MLDETDSRILNIIQTEGRLSNAELARQLNLAPSGVLERVKKLEKRGIITGYETRLDNELLGLSITTFIHILTNDRVGSTEVGKQLCQIPEIREVHWIAGETNYLIKACLHSTGDLTQLLKVIGSIKGVQDTRTTLVLETMKDSDIIPAKQLEPKTESN